MDHALKYLREKGQSVYQHAGISVVKVADEQEGINLVLPLFQEILDRQTVLYLSGGRTPKNLYAAMAKEEQIHPGAFAMVDERYGTPMHENSNEKMLHASGLKRYATALGIPFHLILSGHPEASPKDLDSSPSVQNDINRKSTAEKYDDTVRTLLAQYQKHIAILGVGMDGHTAGIPAKFSLFDQGDSLLGVSLETWVEDLRNRSKNRMVIDYDDKGGFYKERITMTFQGLSMMDVLIVLVFGKDKKPALELMFSDGIETVRQAQGEEEVPSRFFKRPEIARKTLLITDQEVA